MKIIKRIAEEAFCFTEIHFDSLDEYKTEYPKFAQVHTQIRQEANKAKQNNLDPFKGDEFNNR